MAAAILGFSVGAPEVAQMMTYRWQAYVDQMATNNDTIAIVIALGAVLVIAFFFGRWGAAKLGLTRLVWVAYAAGLAMFVQTIWICLDLMP